MIGVGIVFKLICLLGEYRVRLLIYSPNYSPELTGIGKYTGEMASWLASRGHSIRVVTAPPYYPKWHISAGYSSLHYSLENLDGVSVWRCPLYVPVKPTGLKRILHLASFALSSMPVMLWQVLWRPEVVWVIEPTLMCTPFALISSRLANGQSWLHVQDFEVDAAFDLGIVKAGWLKSLAFCTESWLMCRFNRVSTISANMFEILLDKGVSAEKTVLFPNWVDVNAIFPDCAAGEAARFELGLSSTKKVVLYSGNMGEKQGLEFVVAAMHLLADMRDLVFVLCGEGAVRFRLQQATKGLGNVHWLPLQPLDKLNGLLNMADAHLLPQKKGAADLVMPSKLTGIFASGKPVIVMAEPGTALFYAVEGRGVIVPPEDPKAFADAIVGLLADKDRCAKMGTAGRRFAVESLGKDAILREFEDKLLELR
jgi:colanic acid biosynthesis glycosyl transferase WcaI